MFARVRSTVASRLPVGVWMIIAFTLAYLTLATVGAMLTGNLEFVIYIAVLAVLIVAVGILHLHFNLNAWSLAALSLWGLAHMAGGLIRVPASWPIDGTIRVLYSWWIVPHRLKYDQVVHAYGFGVTTWVCWQVLAASLARYGNLPLRQIRPSFSLLLICATSAMGFGALNEIIEFAATLLVPETNVGGYVNTGWDLVSNGVGAVVAAALIRIAGSRAPR